MRPRWPSQQRPWVGARWPSRHVGVNRLTWEPRLCILAMGLAVLAGGFIAKPLALLAVIPGALLVVGTVRSLNQQAEVHRDRTHVFPPTQPRRK